MISGLAKARAWMAAVSMLLTAVPVACSDAPAPPGVVVIYADDVDFDEIGAFGGKVLSPHIDGLARHGAVFSRFYVTSAACTPSRYSALTGRYASRSRRLAVEYPHGGPVNLEWNAELGPDEDDVVQRLAASGYRTGLVGKWHLLQEPPMLSYPLRTLPNPDPADAAALAGMRERYDARVAFMKSAYGFDYVASLYVGNPGTEEGLGSDYAEHNAEWLAEGAVEFVKSVDDGEPFFLWLAPTLLHGNYAGQHRRQAFGMTPLGPVEGTGLLSHPNFTLRRVVAHRYGAHTVGSTRLDDIVGAVVIALRDAGRLENTLVLFVSDHQSRGKFGLYEGSRVPAIAYWPAGIARGTVIDQLVANVDIAPTLMDFAGLAGEAGPVDGRSFLPLLRGDPGGWRQSLYLEIAYARAIVTSAWKYIAVRLPDRAGDPGSVDWDGRPRSRWSDDHASRFRLREEFPHYDDRDQLYDLVADPLEQRNLVGVERHEPRLAAMRQLLREATATLPHAFGEFSEPKAARGP